MSNEEWERLGSEALTSCCDDLVFLLKSTFTENLVRVSLGEEVDVRNEEWVMSDTEGPDSIKKEFIIRILKDNHTVMIWLKYSIKR